MADNDQIIRHPLYDVLSMLINRYGLNILSVENVQKCRGLLKDIDKNNNTEDIHTLCDLLAKDIYSSLTNIKNEEYTKQNLLNRIYKMAGKSIIKNKKNNTALGLLIDVMVENEYLVLKPERKIPKIYWLKIRLPLLLSLVGIAILIFCISTNFFADFRFGFRRSQTAQETSDTTPENAAIYAYVSSYALNLREGPSSSTKIIAVLDQDTKVQVIDNNGPWWKIKYNNLEGYADADYLSNTPVSAR
jgi:hypothetical protein